MSDKEAGTQAFKDQNFAEAVRLYSRAIDASPQDEVLYSNRSAAHAKLKCRTIPPPPPR
jgi:Flp pilus assembly protein TadD